MRIAGSTQTVRVCVSEDALIACSPVPDERELREQPGADRPALEAVANDKYIRKRISAHGKVLITAADALSLIE
jgi:hypothetical protein